MMVIVELVGVMCLLGKQCGFVLALFQGWGCEILLENVQL